MKLPRVGGVERRLGLDSASGPDAPAARPAPPADPLPRRSPAARAEGPRSLWERFTAALRGPSVASRAVVLAAIPLALPGCAAIVGATSPAARGVELPPAPMPVSRADSTTGLLPGEIGRFPLPFPAAHHANVTVGAHFSDYQLYVDDARAPPPLDAKGYGDYVHAGLDLRAPGGTPVTAIKGGRVTFSADPAAAFSKYHFSVVVHELDAQGREVGRRWDYAHLDPKALPAEILAAAKSGAPIAAGTTLGQVVRWIEGEAHLPDQIDRQDGQRYDHLHLNFVVTDPAGKDHYVNLGKYLELQDHVPPTIAAIHLVRDGTRSRLDGPVSGKIDVAIEAFDRIDGAAPGTAGPFTLGIHRAELEVTRPGDGVRVFATESPAFDSVESGGDTVAAAYLRGLETSGGVERARGDRFGRRSFFVVTSSTSGAERGARFDAGGAWDTRTVPDGTYRLKVRVFDAKGNSSEAETAVVVKNAP